MQNEINTQRPSPSSPQEQAEPRLEAGEGLDVTACSASSLLEEMGGLYQTADGIPQASFGSASDRKHFQVSYMGCTDDLLVVSKIDESGRKSSNLISNYQGLLELRDLMNSAYDSLHSYVSSPESQS